MAYGDRTLVCETSGRPRSGLIRPLPTPRRRTRMAMTPQHKIFAPVIHQKPTLRAFGPPGSVGQPFLKAPAQWSPLRV
jgi:hypothetical protein